MNTHDWSNDFRELLNSMSIMVYSTSLFNEVIDAYGVTRKSFNSSFRTRYKDISNIKDNADYYAKKATYMVVDDKENIICSFADEVSDIITASSYDLICQNTACYISLPTKYSPATLDDYLSIATELKNGSNREQALFRANERYFNRIDLILHHLQDVDLSTIAEANAEMLHGYLKKYTNS